MADMIKEFMKKQTTPLAIGVPKQRTEEVAKENPAVQQAAFQPVSSIPASAEQQVVATVSAPEVKAKVGRPKSEIEKTKLSVYVPVEAKAKLVKIQHTTFRQNLNDVLLEAVQDLLKKYGE